MKKYKVMENLGLKLIALFFAAVLWLVVVNIDDPVMTRSFGSIAVQVTNKQIVTNKGNTYQILDDTQTVTVKVSAKRSVLEKLTADDIVAEADMREMEMNSLIPIKVTVPRYADQCRAEASPNNLVVEISPVRSKVFPLTVSATGTPQNGSIIGNMTAEPEKIRIEGSKALVDSIDKAVVKIDVNGIFEDSVLEGELVLYDAQGNVIDQSKLANNVNEKVGVQAKVQVLSTKEVPLNFNVSGTPAEGYLYAGWTSEPQQVQVSGTKEDLEELETIEIPSSELNIEGESEKVEKTIDILPYLPEGIQLVDSAANNVFVSVMIEQEDARTVEIAKASIQVKNLDEKLEVSFESGGALELKFTGPEEKLEQLDITNSVSINLKDCTSAGIYEVTVNVDLPEGIQLVSEQKIKVVLREKKESASEKDSENE